MARKARIKSSTGIYHVLIRAIANLPLFTDEEDYQIYTSILNELQQQDRCEIYAYALFPTHVHILIKDGSNIPDGEMIGGIVKRIAASYSYFFNVKYDHYGPIYMDRFKSNPVETKDYFLKVLDHIGSQATDTKYTCHHIPSILHSSPFKGDREGLLLDFQPRKPRITDSRLLEFLQNSCSFTNIGEFLQRPEEDITTTIKAAKEIGGSIRQIVRLTGTPYQSVFKVRV